MRAATFAVRRRRIDDKDVGVASLSDAASGDLDSPVMIFSHGLFKDNSDVLSREVVIKLLRVYKISLDNKME